MSYPSIYDLRDILFDEQKCVEFLRERRAFYEDWRCVDCDKPMKFYPGRLRFRCPTKKCSKEIPLRKNTFFENVHLPIHKTLHLGYLWLKGDNSTSIQGTTKHSKHTVADFTNYFRELVADSLNCEDTQIGGPNIVVELDETKVGKRKYNRGHRVEGIWVLGGVERTPERKCFVVTVPNRKAETLINIIGQCVLSGSIIHTDLWRGYAQLGTISDYKHLTVNHSQYFCDPDTGVHTNTIEGTWSGLKRRIPIRDRTERLIGPYLWEFIWRRKNKERLWDAFIDALVEVHYD
jgi:hypothetical protein